MKLLITYDGSDCSDAAIADLARAGLPAVAQATVLTVAEIAPQVVAVPYGAEVGSYGMYLPQGGCGGETPVDEQLREAEVLAKRAAARLGQDFPNWHIEAESWAEGPSSAIIREARLCQPDLLVLGSHGRSGLGRLLLGSVSQRVLHHVACAVRISRQHHHPQDRPIRLILAVDGSGNARAAVAAAASRNWPPGTTARVIAVHDSRLALAAANTPDGVIPVSCEEEMRCRLQQSADEAVATLSRAGVSAETRMLEGYPAEVLLEESERWAADSIFIGARGLNAFERLLLGSVSTAVATKAHCSVEVVRAR